MNQQGRDGTSNFQLEQLQEPTDRYPLQPYACSKRAKDAEYPLGEHEGQ